ncbi:MULTISPECIES: DUF389 domain-containing protein [Nocardioides]|uniref:DUF389 domain-containing protein n=2 Tax=Nocardioidaceae TaxID=85015 RepID=UPI00187B062A|nr:MULTISPECIES: DUF389 domain-containing protein [Nocardioides]MBJ7528605.1 DUF389 domain-containing protein [Nocardioides sp.]MCM3514345.1 DUF389 domain-containing protein [Nocardioides sp. P86]
MLLHLRVTAPADLTESVCQTLCRHDWITNVTLQRGVVLEPAGDLVEADVAREKAGPVIRELTRLGLRERGGIVVTSPTGTPFDAADRLERAAPGHPDDAVIWESVEAAAEAGAVPTVSFHVFLVLAVVLAAVAVITDSAVLVIGAMVVGPEFSAIAATCAGLLLGRWGLVGRGLRLLVLSFLLAIVVVTLLAVLARATGLVTLEEVVRERPNTGFIWHPDRWSFIVALVAGAAGALALAIEKTATMVGVFISVTTVPAAGNLALGLAFLDGGEIRGSLAQLGLNVAGMIIAGTLVLVVMRLWWTPITVASERLFRRLS